MIIRRRVRNPIEPAPCRARADHRVRSGLLLALEQARTAAGLTQIEVAKQLQRPQSFVSKYESGERRLDLVELLEVADAIGLSVADLLSQLRKLPAR